MAITLTTSYQKIAEVNIGVASGSKYHVLRLYARYTSQSTANNTTTVQYQLRHYTPTYYSITYYSSSQKITGDVTASSSNAQNKQFSEGETTLLTKSKDITHNNDGSKSISVGGSFTNSYFGNTVTIKNTTVNLPKINRLATVTSASDFTDEENPTLEFTNPAGFTVYPYLNFYDNDNNLVHQLIRNSESATSPYTWDITEEERTALWKATNKQQSYKVSVGVDTYNGTTKLGYNSKSQTMTYVNAEPTYTYEIIDENTKVTDLLGTSAEYLVQNVSQPKITIYPSAKKEATISNVALSYNGVGSILQSEPYEKSYIANSTDFLVRVYDSRLFYVGQDTITRNIIEYLTVNIDSFSFKRENPTSSNIILNAQIRYKQAMFGSTDNVPTIKWKLGAEGELNALTTQDYTMDEENNRITISNLVLSDVLPYTSEGRFYLYVNDLLTEDTENDIVIKGIPTCDMGEHDFQVNGELYIANENRENKKEIRDLIVETARNILFPIGSTYITTTNSNPSSYLGGTWELVDKALKYTSTESGTFTRNTTNTSNATCAIMAVDHTMRCRLKWANKVNYNDDTYELGTITPEAVGLNGWPYGLFSFHGGSDGANSVLLVNITDQGVVSVVDTISKSSGTTSSTEQPCYIDFTLPVKWSYMLDSFCDRFYWKRTA